MAIPIICPWWNYKTWRLRDCGHGCAHPRRLLPDSYPYKQVDAYFAAHHVRQHRARSKKSVPFRLLKQFSCKVQNENGRPLEFAQVSHAWSLGSMLGNPGAKNCSKWPASLSSNGYWYSGRRTCASWHACIYWARDHGESLQVRCSQSVEGFFQPHPTGWIAWRAIGR